MAVANAQATIAARMERVPLFSMHRKLVFVLGVGTFFDLFDIALGGLLAAILANIYHRRVPVEHFFGNKNRLCFVYSPQASHANGSAFTRSESVFRVGSNHQRPPLCLERSLIGPEANPNCLRKPPVTTSTGHPSSPNQTTGRQETGSASADSSRQDGSDLETGPLSRLARDASAAAIVSSSVCSKSANHRRTPESRGSPPRRAVSSRKWQQATDSGEILRRLLLLLRTSRTRCSPLLYWVECTRTTKEQHKTVGAVFSTGE